MKNLIAGLILLCLCSCNIVKIFGNQEIYVLEKCTPIAFDNSMPLVNIEIDSIQSKFLLDTGATISVLVDSSGMADFQNKKFTYYGSSVGADKKATKNRFFTANIISETVSGKNKVLAFFNLPKRECSKKQNFTGILGMDVFFDRKLSLVLDFSNNQLCNVSEENKTALLRNGNYERVKSECKKRSICIFLNIENVDYKFKLDTGFNGNLIIPKSKSQNFKSKDFLEFEGSAFATLTTTTIGDELIYGKMPMTFGSQKIQSPVIVSSTIASQNAGINFIKKFDWIIDYENNEVYIKPNSNIDLPVSDVKAGYKAAVNDGSLFISLKEISESKYNFGDQIIAVNSRKVTIENICELLSFLNKTENWNTLDLEVIHK